MPLVLAIAGFLLSIWIVVPGPILPLFILTVGGTELWPFLAIFNVAALIVNVRSQSRARNAGVPIAALALVFSLVPPFAYLTGSARATSIGASGLPARDRPAIATAAPVVLAIYGGAWEHGSPKNDRLFNAIVASWGYRVIALDYPHAPQARWPAQREAILRQIDALPPGRIAIVGHSSGAQLAMIAAALRPKRIRAVVTYESPVDLQLGYRYPSQPDVIHLRQVLIDLCGGTPEQRPDCYRSASPRYVVRAGMPPVLMFAAGRDHVVNLSFEHLLRDQLRRDGVSVWYVEFPWADHAFEDVPLGFHNSIALGYLRRFLDLTLR